MPWTIIFCPSSHRMPYSVQSLVAFATHAEQVLSSAAHSTQFLAALAYLRQNPRFAALQDLVKQNPVVAQAIAAIAPSLVAPEDGRTGSNNGRNGSNNRNNRSNGDNRNDRNNRNNGNNGRNGRNGNKRAYVSI